MVFKIHPLEIVLYMHIKKQVLGKRGRGRVGVVIGLVFLLTQIFGTSVRDAFVSEDLLVVLDKRNICRYYSLQWIMDNVRKGKMLLVQLFRDNDG